VQDLSSNENIKPRKSNSFHKRLHTMNEEGLSLEEKLELLQERSKELGQFLETLVQLKTKLQKKKGTIKEIIQKKIEDNEKELQKWKDLLFIVVDESLDEKIDKLASQENYCRTTHAEIERVLESSKTSVASSGNKSDDESDSESEDPKLDDLLALDLSLQPDGLTQAEATEMESRIKTDFNVLLNEPKKSLRRTFAYVGGIIRGYLRRGKSNINWIKVMRQLEGREFEERMLNESDPYVGTKLPLDDEELTDPRSAVQRSEAWDSMIKLFENRNNQEARAEFCDELYKYYDDNPEDVEFYLPQLCNLLLNQYTTFQPLKKFILDKCRDSVHFALRTYLHVRAAKDSREPPKKKKITPPSIIRWRVLCNQLLTDIQNAILEALNKDPNLLANLPANGKVGEMTAEDLFNYQVRFMDSLVDISRHLTTVPSDQYANELRKKLTQEDQNLQNLQHTYGQNVMIYIPLLKPIGSADYHTIIRIPAGEAYPIPTYGRVLFYLCVEVVDREIDRDRRLSREPSEEGTEKERRKHKKKKKEKHRESELSSASSSLDIKELAQAPSTTQANGVAIVVNGNMSQPPAANGSLTQSTGTIPIPDSEDEDLSLKKSKKEKKHKKKKDREKEERPADESNSSGGEVHGQPGQPSSGTPLSTSPTNASTLATLIPNIGNNNNTLLIPPMSPTKALPAATSTNLLQQQLSTIPELTLGKKIRIEGYAEKPLGSHIAFGELFGKKFQRMKHESPYGAIDRWRMQPLIVKSGEEVLQEEFAMQMIVQFQRIFFESKVPVRLKPYRILAVSSKAGFIEPIPNSLSLDKLKKQHTNLLNFFIQTFGESSEPPFKQAQLNFVKTMAGYSVVCFILQIKDRHNGNILLDTAGQIIHIDFGYLLSKTIAFEKAPFKLTNEFVEVMGGYKSPCYKEYCKLCVKAYMACRKHYKQIMLLVEMTMEGKGKKVLPCLQGGKKVLDDLLERFHLDWTDEQCEKFVMEMIEEARGSWRTIVYDAYQLILNNIQS